MSIQMSPIMMSFTGEPTHWCPGCKMIHMIHVNKSNPYNGARWTWNENWDRPTFEPSIYVVGRCHYWIKDGWIQFLDDCMHAYAGRTVPIPVLPDGETKDLDL